MTIGIILSLISSFLIAVYVYPKKFSKFPPHIFMFFMSVGYFVFATSIFLILQLSGVINENVLSPWLWLSALNGVNVVIASNLFITAIDKIGVAKASQFKSIQGPIGALLIMIIFSEWQNNNIYLLLAGILIMWFTALLFNVKNKDGTKVKLKWILVCLLSALIFSSNILIRKVVFEKGGGLQFSQQLYVSIFVLLAAAIYALLKEKKFAFIKKTFTKDGLFAIAGGTFDFTSTILAIIALNYLPGSIATTLRELSVLWSVLFGIFVFKEISFKKHKVRLSIAFLFVVLSIFTLYLSRIL